MLTRRSLLLLSTIAALVFAAERAGAETGVPSPSATVRPGTPTPAPLRIDLKRFTVDGIGLTSTVDDVTRVFGPPDEEQKIFASEEVKKMLEEAEKEEAIIEKRIPEQQCNRIVYGYFDRGIKVTFDEEDMKLYTMELFVAPSPPYGQCRGSLGASLPLDVRESQLLRPLASQIYKDWKNVLYLKKDGRDPLRETAVLAFSVEGWLTRLTFKWEENYDINIDDFCVGGVCLGDEAKKAVERFGPPDFYGAKGNQLTAEWHREGLRMKARRNDQAITDIAVLPANFDGGFVQPLLLTNRKEAFHDYLDGRIYQEGSAKICAYAKGEPRSIEKAVLIFDEDDRLKSLVFDTIENVEVDFDAMTAAGVKVGDPAEAVRRRLGRFSKWRDLGDSIVAGYHRYGMRVFMNKKGGGGGRKKGAQTSAPQWTELSNVSRIELAIKDHTGLYSVPLSLADTLKTYEKKGRARIFRRKGNALYMSRDGRTPNPGVAAVVAFEKLGWPRLITFREFNDLIVDLKAFTVAGLGLGAHADRVFKVLGTPERRRVTRQGDLEILSYVEKGITVVIDPLNRSVCKITIDLERFEGSFAQELTLDSDADDYEKVAHSLIYKQDEKTFWLSPDGKAPTWEEGVVYFSLTGDVKQISFLNLGVAKEGILLDITKELE